MCCHSSSEAVRSRWPACTTAHNGPPNPWVGAANRWAIPSEWRSARVLPPAGGASWTCMPLRQGPEEQPKCPHLLPLHFQDFPLRRRQPVDAGGAVRALRSKAQAPSAAATSVNAWGASPRQVSGFAESMHGCRGCTAEEGEENVASKYLCRCPPARAPPPAAARRWLHGGLAAPGVPCSAKRGTGRWVRGWRGCSWAGGVRYGALRVCVAQASTPATHSRVAAAIRVLAAGGAGLLPPGKGPRRGRARNERLHVSVACKC